MPLPAALPYRLRTRGSNIRLPCHARRVIMIKLRLLLPDRYHASVEPVGITRHPRRPATLLHLWVTMSIRISPRVLPRCSNIRLKLQLLRIMSLSAALPYRLRPTLATARSSLTLLQLPCRQGMDLSKKISGVYMKVILPKPTRRPNTMRSYLLPKPSRRQNTMWSYSRVLTVKR